MNLFIIIIAGLLLLPVIAVRLVFLIPGRLGWINYLANTFSEFFVKKIGWSRTWVEAGIACVGIGLIALSGSGWAVTFGGVTLVLALEVYVCKVERWMLTTSWTPLDPIGIRKATPEQTKGLARGYPSPSTHPELTFTIIGPFVERLPRYQLGTLLVGRAFELRLVIGNHTIVPTQTGIRLRIEAPPEVAFSGPSEQLLAALGAGEVHEMHVGWEVRAARGNGLIRLVFEWGNFSRALEIEFDACTNTKAQIAGAALKRYPGACRSAFAWRGDMDLYDESTLQSIEGLESTLSLAARYRMPQTMYLSTRLSLDEAAARKWADHYGVDRGARRIPELIEWIREKVDLRHECAYPFQSQKPYLIELGNHGHLHFGTDTAGAEENGWKPKARMGAGKYPWLGPNGSSLAEQRDNAMEARRFCEKFFNYSPKSWAMPNRTNDRDTAAAMEAAGCEVLSDSNVRTRDNVLLQPPPHHPKGTSAVELTKRYPGDPQHVYHVAMNLFWIHRAHRRAIPVVFMCHQHLRQFDGHACTRLTEYTLRYVLSRFNGDLHINTVYGIGKYWREVLSPKTRRIQVELKGDRIVVCNHSDMDLVDAPLDITLSNGSRFTVLVSVPRNTRICFTAHGTRAEERIPDPTVPA